MSDALLPTHRLVETYCDHEIWQRQPGFEYTPVMLGKIASFLVHWQHDRLAVFAFSYSLLERLEQPDLSEDALLAAARAVIRQGIDRSLLRPGTDTTFTHRDGDYVEVRAPAWWIPTFP